jgi:hypothetical protein
MKQNMTEVLGEKMLGEFKHTQRQNAHLEIYKSAARIQCDCTGNKYGCLLKQKQNLQMIPQKTTESKSTR